LWAMCQGSASKWSLHTHATAWRTLLLPVHLGPSTVCVNIPVRAAIKLGVRTPLETGKECMCKVRNVV
jgi:hypothetical protein